MSDSDSTEPNESFEDRVKKVMMGEFDKMLEIINKREDSTYEYLRKYLTTELTKLQGLAQQIDDNQNTLTPKMEERIKKFVGTDSVKYAVKARVKDYVKEMVGQTLDVDRIVREYVTEQFLNEVGNIHIDIKKGEMEAEIEELGIWKNDKVKEFVHAEIEKIRNEVEASKVENDDRITNYVPIEVYRQLNAQLNKLGIDKPKPKVDTEEINERIDSISNQVLEYKNNVEELSANVATIDSTTAKLQKDITDIGTWTPYRDGTMWKMFPDASWGETDRGQWKILDQIFENFKDINTLKEYDIKDNLDGVAESLARVNAELKKLDSEYDAKTTTNTGWSLWQEQPPNPTVQLPAARKQDPTLLLKDLPLLHM